MAHKSDAVILAQDGADLKRRRVERGAPKPEAEFLRDREAAIKKLMGFSEIERRECIQQSLFPGKAAPPSDPLTL